MRSEAVLRGRVGGLTTHAKHSSDEIAARARAGFNARFEREVDPDGTLPVPERARRAEYARKAHFARLALASARARSKKVVRDVATS
jgi:hypothetical protein